MSLGRPNRDPRTGARLSVLDTAMVGRSAERALADTVALAQEAERLGFQRYWMAEHHGTPGVASTAPAITVGAIAAATSRIRVGSGGVMLPNHVPLVVAEQFGTLAALYPGRVDLGVGRASPDPLTALVFSQSLAECGAEDFDDRVVQLLGFLSGEFPAPHRFDGVYVSPRAEEPPAVWVLGSSSAGAALAGALGLPFAFAHHFGRGDAPASFELYRRHFRPSRALSEPYTLITLLTAVADTDEEAARTASSADLMFHRLLLQGRPGLLPSLEEVDSHHWTEAESAFARKRRVGQAIGSPETVAAVAEELLERTAADEVMLTTQLYRLEDRVRSLQLAASALSLSS